MPDSTTTTHDTAIILTPPVLRVLLVAMTAMVKDVSNGPQVMLTPSEWEIAEKVLKDLDAEINDAQ